MARAQQKTDLDTTMDSLIDSIAFAAQRYGPDLSGGGESAQKMAFFSQIVDLASKVRRLRQEADGPFVARQLGHPQPF